MNKPPQNVGKKTLMLEFDPHTGKITTKFMSTRWGRLPVWKYALAHALHYGTGGFEGIRAYDTEKGPAVFGLREHSERLIKTMKALGIESPITAQGLMDVTLETLRRNGFGKAYIRPWVGWAHGPLGVHPKNGEEGNKIVLFITPMIWGKYVQGTKVLLASNPRRTAMPNDKISGNYANSLEAIQEASKHGYAEALTVNQRGHVAEGSGENIFWIKGDTLYTPSLNAGILPGITRETIIKIARERRLYIKQGKFGLHHLLNADEVFYTGTAAEVSPVTHVGIQVKEGRIHVMDLDRPVITPSKEEKINKTLKKRGITLKEGITEVAIGSGEVGAHTTEIGKMFNDIVTGQNPEYEHMLTPIYTQKGLGRVRQRLSWKANLARQVTPGVRVKRFSLGRKR